MLSITVTGNLGQDAELKVTKTGTPVLSFGVASTDRHGTEKVTTWARCSLFGKRGEALAQYLRKGTSVCVIGTPHIREYQSQGATKFSLDVNVTEVALMGGGERQEARPAAPQPDKWQNTRQANLGSRDDEDIPF